MDDSRDAAPGAGMHRAQGAPAPRAGSPAGRASQVEGAPPASPQADEMSFGDETSGEDEGSAQAAVSRLLGLAAYSLRTGSLERGRRLFDAAQRQGGDPFVVALGRARLAI